MKEKTLPKINFLDVVLYLCLGIYPLVFFMGYKHLTFDYSTALGDTIFNPAYGPLCSLVVLLMVPLGIVASFISYMRLEKDSISKRTIFLLISPIIQLLLCLIITPF